MSFTNYSIEEPVSKFMYRVYGWMAAALALTASVAYYIGTSDLFEHVVNNPVLFWGVIIVQFILVISLSAAIMKIDYTTAVIGFLVYAILNGITLSFVFNIYLASSIYSTFFVTAGMFAGMAFYGYTTKANLTSMGSIAIMFLWGLILGRLVNIFFKSTQMEMMFSFIGVIVFCLLTAYDVQKIKSIYMKLYGTATDLNKITILGALTLYLDFINLFLHLLRFMGKRKDS